jgi:hypothetical protein
MKIEVKKIKTESFVDIFGDIQPEKDGFCVTVNGEKAGYLKTTREEANEDMQNMFRAFMMPE